MRGESILTCESVTEGQPDKIADQISDAILDAIIEEDKDARVACETLITNGYCLIAGEIRTKGYAPIDQIARQTIREIGYTSAELGFDYRSSGILTSITDQSEEVALGLKIGGKQGAGDGGMMVGYATDESESFLPLPLQIAHAITLGLSRARKELALPFLRPDGKAQVSLAYKNGAPFCLTQVVVNAQHDHNVSPEALKEAIIEEVIKPILPAGLDRQDVEYLINPTGLFVMGGPQADTGVTGRKTIVDTYGGAVPHGGGSFSGKDPSKMDRTASYFARYIAKNFVAAGIAKKMMVQLTYHIGATTASAVSIETFGTSKFENSAITEAVKTLFDLSPSAMIETLDLLRPIYKKCSVYGHFGRNDPSFYWERTDRIDDIKGYFKRL